MEGNLRLLNANAATPEVILAEVSEKKPKLLVCIMVDESGQQMTYMSAMNIQDICFMQTSFQSQVMDFVRGRNV